MPKVKVMDVKTECWGCGATWEVQVPIGGGEIETECWDCGEVVIIEIKHK